MEAPKEPMFQVNDLVELREARGRRKWRVEDVLDDGGEVCTIQRLHSKGDAMASEAPWTGNLPKNGDVLLHRPKQ